MNEPVLLKHDLLSTRYTRVYHEHPKDMQYKAPHNFKVRTLIPDYDPEFGEVEPIEKTVGVVNFQCGPIGEVGVNGVMNEDLIAMVIARLQHFNNTDFQCRENSMAITKLEEALMWLGKRTNARLQRGVEGTHKV